MVGSMRGHDPRVSTAENYRRFGAAAADRSVAYAELAAAVAEDTRVLEFLDSLPAAKRQPNLLFAAARYVLGAVPDHAQLRALALDDPSRLAAVIRQHRTQTNEPARCATLLPALAAVSEPLALLEVGAAAGLTLLPDRYSYDFAGHRIVGSDPQAPVLPCRPLGGVPLPDRVPRVGWRAGIDLHPLDADDSEHARWLECLIWPGETDRPQRLRAALDTARRVRPAVHAGDLVEDLARVAADAPAGTSLVIYHSAVLAYVDERRRAAFAEAVAELGAVWLSNEAPGIVSASTAGGDADSFALVRNGGEHVADTDSHGAWIRWRR